MTMQIKHKDQTYTRMLTIDVGDHTGWAFWDGEKIPSKYGMIELDRKCKRMEEQLGYMQLRFRNLVKELDPVICVLEGVEIWANDLRSMTAAKRGNLTKLSYLVGMYAATCLENDVEVHILVAREWKGQLKDPMVMSRVYHLTNIYFTKSQQHIADAVGIGLSLQGLFYRTNNNPERVRRFKIVKTQM